MDERTALAQRVRLFSQFEQLQTGLRYGDADAEMEARRLLARVVSRGSCDLLAQVFRGIVLAWDEEQSAWDEIP